MTPPVSQRFGEAATAANPGAETFAVVARHQGHEHEARKRASAHEKVHDVLRVAGIPPEERVEEQGEGLIQFILPQGAVREHNGRASSEAMIQLIKDTIPVPPARITAVPSNYTNTNNTQVFFLFSEVVFNFTTDDLVWRGRVGFLPHLLLRFSVFFVVFCFFLFFAFSCFFSNVFFTRCFVFGMV